MAFENVPFAVKVHRLNLTDSGFASARVVGDEGFRVHFKLHVFPNDPDRTLVPYEINVPNRKIDVQFKGVKHR
jgi:hypothetical protein